LGCRRVGELGDGHCLYWPSGYAAAAPAPWRIPRSVTDRRRAEGNVRVGACDSPPLGGQQACARRA
jgi:hypothetical protein